ncbi:hypothetical protein AB4379_12175 [Vibrio breoganii]
MNLSPNQIKEGHDYVLPLIKEHLPKYLEYKKQELNQLILTATDTKEVMTNKSIYQYLDGLLVDLNNLGE